MEFLTNFVKNLIPDLTRDRLIEDLRNTRTMLDSLQEIYEVALPVMRNYKFQSPEVIDRVDKFKRITGARNNPVVYFSENIPNIIKNLDIIKTAFIGETNKAILASSLTIKQANLIAYVDALYLVNKGARKFLVWMEAHESAFYNRTQSELVEEIVPAEEKWLSECFVDFCNATKIVSLTADKTMEKLESIIDSPVTEKGIRALQAANRMNAADPLNLGFIGTKYNPIVFFRMMVAEWQVARFREAEDELRGLRLQLGRLENTSRGKNDPRLEQEIKYMRGRVNSLAKDVQEMENKYGK